MTYIDGFVLAVPEANKELYRDHAARAAQIFLDHGALSLVEAWGDEIPDGTYTDFKKAVQAKPDEVVVFSWISWPSREARDVGMKCFMEDERLKDMTDMPFDGKRMIFGGFETLVHVQK